MKEYSYNSPKSDNRLLHEILDTVQEMLVALKAQTPKETRDEPLPDFDLIKTEGRKPLLSPSGKASGKVKTKKTRKKAIKAKKK